MTKLCEIFCEDIPIAFIKQRIDGSKKCQRYPFPDNIPEISFVVPTPVYNKFGVQVRIDNRSKTIKSLIKKITEQLDLTDLTIDSIKKVLQDYIDIDNYSKPIFRLINEEKVEEN